ncbi:MAG: ECF transporter S component [Erysipelotrichaceae bacterium]|nr:ECF transporter S component [Erysipelotrichaceae bacterium]
MMKKLNVREIALIGVLGGMAGVLMLFRTPLPFMPPFMDFDLASLPELIGGFAMGPVAAVCIILVKLLVKLALVGTNSMFTGEISNLLLSLSYVLPAVILYHRHKNKRSAVNGMLVGTILCAIAAVLTNLLLIIPFYVNLYGMSMEDILMMCQAVNPYVSDTLMLALLGIIPFNLIKRGAESLLTLLLYKKISPMLKQFVKKQA